MAARQIGIITPYREQVWPCAGEPTAVSPASVSCPSRCAVGLGSTLSPRVRRLGLSVLPPYHVEPRAVGRPAARVSCPCSPLTYPHCPCSPLTYPRPRVRDGVVGVQVRALRHALGSKHKHRGLEVHTVDRWQVRRALSTTRYFEACTASSAFGGVSACTAPTCLLSLC